MLTPEQLALRQQGYGASEVATIVGRGHGKIEDVWESKLQPRAYDEAVNDEELARDLGTLMEDPVARIYAKRHRVWLAPCETFRHPTRPLAFATPDRARFITEAAWKDAREKSQAKMLGYMDRETCGLADRLVEVKTHAQRYRRDYGAAGSGQIPEHEAIQTTWQMAVTGVHACDLPVLFMGDFGKKLEVFTVTFNQSLFDALYECVERFHVDYVLAKKKPPPDGSDRFDEFIARAYPTHNAPPVVASRDDEELMLRFAKFREVERRAKMLKQKCAQELKLRIGSAEGMMSAEYGKLSYKRSADGTEVDWQKAAQDAMALGGVVLDGLKRLAAQDARPSTESLVELEARLKAIVPDATVTKPGYRALRPYFKGAAALELARLELAMDALEGGE
jgi:hypothetical protein